MDFKIENGNNIISIGYSGIGAYLKIKKPVSLIWHDCAGSVGQYLCMMPYPEAVRNEILFGINNSLYEDYTNRIDDLYQNLLPLLLLLENGNYQLNYYNGNKRYEYAEDVTANANAFKKFALYPEVVDLSRVTELRKNYKDDMRARGLQDYRDGLVSFTSSWIYLSWDDDMYIATRPSTKINPERVKFFEDKIAGGQRPLAILINAFHAPYTDYSNDFVLDGHHKLQAYANLNIEPAYALITRNFDTVGEPEFDVESLAKQLYPWQIKHILDNWDEEDGDLSKFLTKPNSALHQYIKNGHVKEYHDNGKIKTKAFYINNKVEGKLLEWYDSGVLKKECYFTNEKNTCVWNEWFASGQLRSTHEYNNKGQIHGKSVSYFENGEERSKAWFINGAHADGYSFYRWGHTQNMEYELWYENNIIIKKNSYSDYGRLIRSEYYDTELNKLVEEPITGYTYYDETANHTSGPFEKDLKIIKERQYPETGKRDAWQIFAGVMLLLIILLRMCN